MLFQNGLHLLTFCSPGLLHLGEKRPALRFPLVELDRVHSRQNLGSMDSNRSAEGFEQSHRFLPGGRDPSSFLDWSWVETVTPEILDNLAAEIGLVFQELKIKQRAGFKGVVLEDALAKAMDGIDGGLIHSH